MPGYHWLPDPLQRRLLEREGRRDLERLARRLPRLTTELGLECAGAGERGSRGEGGVGRADAVHGARDGGLLVRGRSAPDELLEAHGRYLSQPGVDPEMASSLPFADVLGAWCRALRPGAVADLGTGFSSWVVRRWAPEHAEIVSVDDDPEWLERTRAFVRREGLREAEFVSWDAFRRRRRRYELVVWDFSDVRTRAAATPTAADRVAPGGALLYDDVHKHRLWRRVRRMARRRRVEGLSLRAVTLDEHGRYAWLGLFSGGSDG